MNTKAKDRDVIASAPSLIQTPTSQLPIGTELQEIAFSAETPAGGKELWIAPDGGGLKALQQSRVAISAIPQTAQALDRWYLLTVPQSTTEISAAAGESAQQSLAAALEQWASAGSDDANRRCLVIQLQGVVAYWAPGRIAIVSSADRVELVRSAMIEAAYYDSQLRSIEIQVKDGWKQLELDTPNAFDFNDRSLCKKNDLAMRYQQVLAMRAKLARVVPQLHFPSVFPPTVASQIGERIRERVRMVERSEFLSDQLEVYESVYEQCGDRLNEFVLTRSSNKLEWIIILLLIAQLVIVVVELLASTSS